MDDPKHLGPPAANGLHYDGEGRLFESEDQVIGQFARIVEAASDHEPMASASAASMHDGQACPVKEAFPFGAQTLREALLVASTQHLLLDAGDISEQQASAGLDTDDFGTEDGQRVGVALLLQLLSQVGAVTVHRISRHPTDGQASSLSALDHLLGQRGFGAKAEALRNTGGLPAWQISTPFFGRIQLAVDKRMTTGGDVGEEDADLAVFHAPRQPAILRRDARGVATPFGEAAFICDEQREGDLLLLPLWYRGAQALLDQRPYLIAYGVLVPNGAREQSLHAVGTRLPGVFGDLPANFSGDVTQDGLQVQQGMLVDFGARKAGRQALMELVQAHGPGAHRT